ncbi:hypothetical protein CLV24_10417 [Pontibacter ummariensis]|uniref:ZIP Zinc transporter n=2 Tax=Pontibacter ummariensis TaxID=1610492 RepID=A0A239D3M0_9BACT|nr:hypothetical protein [Pontibacter ummariensis]PRY14207.1 hypothetical protein CLV24_10417 [Pontibacter ummariensis]SNS26461.1 hypothetical protein SAMN06296052_10417 [Pontibacter ummariensis]
MMEYVSVVPVAVLALIHYYGGRFSFLTGIPRSSWLSVAGGISVAYIFLHLFPELSEGQEQVNKVLSSLGFLENHIYLLALIGLALFYGLERAALSSKHDQVKKGETEQPVAEVFWVHISSFAVYNALIGYLLFQREEGPIQQMILFAVAMALHFVVNDYGLQDHYHEDYRKKGRWVLVVALVLGWVLGFVIVLPEHVTSMVMAFIGGAVILNVLKEELPEERKSRYWAFLLGAGAYAALLLAL